MSTSTRLTDHPGHDAHAAAGSDTDASPATRTPDVKIARSDIGLLVLSLLVLVGVFYLIGELVLSSSIITSMDDDVADWFVEQRTPTLDNLSLLGSYLAETIVKIVVTAVLAIGMWLAWRRWREPLMLAVPLVLEATAFIIITFLVGRPRPDVERLDSSPVGSSFPSGHVAAAAAYGAIVIVVFWHTRNRWIRAITVLIVASIPVIVALSRMYRGMHFLTDVVAGAILGLASLVASWYIIDRAHRRAERAGVEQPDLQNERLPT